MKVTGTDGEEITVVIISTGFIISKGAWPPSLVTTTSTDNRLSRYSRSAFSFILILPIHLTGTLSIIKA